MGVEKMPEPEVSGQYRVWCREVSLKGRLSSLDQKGLDIGC
jgi:hypothetical protein